jgi:hypothetical protein
MASLQRLLHDGNSSICRRLGFPIKYRRERDGNGIVPTELREAGYDEVHLGPEALLHGIREETVRFEWAPQVLYSIEEAMVVGDNGYIFLPNGEFWVPSLYPHDQRPEIYKIRRPIRWAARQAEETLFHLTGQNHENRGHFMLDHLPRLLAAESWLRENPEVKILIAPGHGSWQREYIEKLGFAHSRVIDGSHGTIRARRLCFVPFLWPHLSSAPSSILSTLRERFSRDIDLGSPGPPIFLSRRDAQARRLTNEEEVVETARRVIPDLECVTLSGMSLDEQVKLFGSSRLFMGPLGQASCNIVFSSSSLIVNLRNGHPEQPFRGGIGTHIAGLAGNEGVTLYSGTDLGDRHDWVFPIGEFRRQLDQLKATGCLDSYLGR